MNIYFFLFNLILFFLLFSVGYNYEKIDKKKIFFDIPDKDRKIHFQAMPLIGGFLFFFGFVTNIIFFYEYFILSESKVVIFLFLSAIFLIVGVIDDKHSLSPTARTIIIFLTLLIILPLNNSFVIQTINFKDIKIEILLNQGSIIFTILCIFFVYNFLNFADGVNGIAISLCLFYISFIYIFGNLSFNLYIIIKLYLILILILNLAKKLFIGNNGSSLLSIVICAVFILSYNNDKTPKADEIFLVFFLPAIDSLRVIIERIAKQKSPIKADKNHFHHLLLKIVKEKYIFLIYTILSIIPFAISLMVKTYYSLGISIIIYFLMIFKLKKI